MPASYQLEPSRDAPSRLGRYELVGHLATGGMAEIHLARLAGEAGFEKIVVVKRLLPELVASPAFVKMFLEEGKLVARLDHPNICEVHELGREGAEYYLAMPFLDGIAAHELIARPRDPDRISQLRVAAGVVVQACAGLHHAHELRDADGAPAGLVHRDVSPSNLFVTSSGIVKVLDFGIAKVRGAAETEAGTVKGKSQYMAPEQLLGDPLDRRCDVFALGIVLYELCTHQRLFKRPSDYLAARAILEEPIPRADAVDPAIPRVLADVIAKALAREPAARHATAQELASAVTGALAEHGGVALPAEIAAAVISTDELSAMRTRQARVIDDARSREGRTQHDAAPTRPMRAGELYERTEKTTRRAAPLWIGLAVLVLAAGVVLYLRSDRIDRTEPAKPAPPPPPVAIAPVVVADAAVPDAAPEIEMPPQRPTRAPVAPAPKPGLLSIDSTPWATIYIDGNALGMTPLVKRSLPAGRHKLRAVTKDGRTQERTIEIPAGKLASPIQLTW